MVHADSQALLDPLNLAERQLIDQGLSRCKLVALFLKFLDKSLCVLTQVAANAHSFNHSDEFIIGEEGNEVGEIQAKEPLIFLDHDLIFLSELF